MPSTTAAPGHIPGGQTIKGTSTEAAKLQGPGQTSPGRSTMFASGKRTFKEKLQGALLEAEQAEAAAQLQAAQQDRKSLAVALLVDGRPQAFVDFFRLTHVRSSGADADAASADSSGDGQGNSLQHDSLLLLKAQLQEADVARRAGRVEDVYAAYKHLARSFVPLGKLQVSEFFFKRCLDISQQAQWLPGELEASLALGMVYEELHDTASAIGCHERRLELATTHGLQVEVDTALASLAKAYMGRAEELERSGDDSGAADAYTRCLRAADQVADADAAAKANHRLGTLSFRQQRWQDALFYLRKYIELTAGGGDVPGMEPEASGVAHTTYARCLEQLGDVRGAMQSLEAYLHAASRGSDTWGPAHASCSLGLLYHQQGDYNTACKHFERFFEVARTLPDRRALEAARFNLGVARGAQRMQTYFQVVASDLPKLIAWKNTKVPFWGA